MSKDLKIGMIIGAVLLIAATLVISFLSGDSLESRLNNKHKNELGPNSLTYPVANGDENSGNAVTPPSSEKIHVVQPGETINDIAEKYFGNPKMIIRIIDANPQIPDNYELKPGMELEIP
jgi:hypothetical protein